MYTASAQALIACHDCDLLIRKQPLRYGESATCVRCGALLYRRRQNSLERTLTFALSALILFVLANVLPFLTFKIQGRVQESVLATGVKELYLQGMWELAAVVLAVSIVIPLIKILGWLYLLLPLKFNSRPWKGASVLRVVETLHPWAMVDVYMLGVLVAIVKLTDIATLVPGVALFSFAALIVIMAASGAALDPEEIWERLGPAQ